PGGLFYEFRPVFVYKSLAAGGPGTETKATQQAARLVIRVYPAQAVCVLKQGQGAAGGNRDAVVRFADILQSRERGDQRRFIAVIVGADSRKRFRGPYHGTDI